MSNNTGYRSLAPQKVLRKTINTTDANHVLVSAVPEKRINILGLSLATSGAGTVLLQSNTTEKGRNVFKATDPAWVLPPAPDAWVECEAGEDFRLNNAGGLTLSGVVVYIVVG